MSRIRPHIAAVMHVHQFLRSLAQFGTGSRPICYAAGDKHFGHVGQAS
jgi:hypothetical protein